MDISKIKIGSTTYDIKDSVARAAATNGTHFIGILNTASEVEGAATSITDGSAPNIIETSLGVFVKGTPAENQVQFQAGDIVMVGSTGANQSAPKEFIWDGSKFQELGSTGSLHDLAFKDSASGSYTPAGSNAPSAVSFEEHTTGTFVTGVNAAAVAPSFTEGSFSAGTLPSFSEGTFSAGTLPSFTEGSFDAGSLPSLGEATTGSFATEGVTAAYDSETEALELSVASTSSAVTAQGTFSAGSLPSKAADTWSAGTLPSKAADTFSAGTLPSKEADSFSAGSAATFSTASAITALGAATAAAQTFTGSAATISVA